MKTGGLCIGAEEKDYVIIQLTDSLRVLVKSCGNSLPVV